MLKKRYFTANDYFKKLFGEKVHRVSIDAGFTCPNRDGKISKGGCIYCNETGSRATYVNPASSIEEQLENGIQHIRKTKNVNKFIAYFQPYTNTYASLDKLKEIYEPALKHPYVVGISIGTRPDCIDDEKLDYLDFIGEKKLVIIEYGVQTLNNLSLTFINRGHDAKTSIETIEKTKKRKNLNIVVHLIFLLPFEDVKQALLNMNTLVKLGINGVKFHHLYVEKNTKLEQLYREGEIKILDREEYVEILANAVSLLPENVVIHRLFGDCEEEKLVAPIWTLEKTKNLNFFNQFLEEKNIWQGKNLT